MPPRCAGGGVPTVDEEILSFLRAIDDELARHAAEGEALDFHLLGRSALVLGFGVRLMTKDVDVVYDHGSTLLDRAVATFGPGTAEAARHGFYLEAVSSGLPPLPIGYRGRCIPIPGPWRVLRPSRPEIHDLAATKLSRFHARDREDVRILCDTGEQTADRLRGVVDLAFAFAADEDEDPKRRAAYANLGMVVDYLEGRRQVL